MSESTSNATPPRKRRRPALSCGQCRRRKIKCDRNYPCGQCTQSKTASCSYDPDTVRRPRHVIDVPSRPAQSKTGVLATQARSTQDISSTHTSQDGRSPGAPSQSSTNVPSSWTSPSDGPNSSEDVQSNSLLHRVLIVEGDTSSNPSGPFPYLCEDYKPSPAARALRGTVSKTRFFGPSHWMYSYGTFDKMALLTVNAKANIMECGISALGGLPPLVGDNNTVNFQNSYDLELLSIGQHIKEQSEKCKALAQSVKRVPYSQWLANPNFRESIPPRDLADTFVNLYFRSSESLYRILHITTFRKEYEQYWQQPSAASTVFLLKLLLVMSIGTISYQGSDALHYRLEATKWIFAAQTWLSAPFEKARLHTSSLQLQCLVMLARQEHSIAGDLVWTSVGQLLRIAMQMGYHRDPRLLPNMSAMQAEIRRRLWATILELNLQSAVDSGMPLMLSPEDYDTQPPANLDDIDISDNTTGAIHSKSSSIFTQCSIQIALLKSFPIRLEVVRFSNSLRREPSYEEVLRVGMELSKACKQNETFLANVNKALPVESRVSQRNINLSDLAIRRFLLLVHRPFAAKGLKDPHYYFSRKVCLDTAIKMLRYPCSKYPNFDDMPSNGPLDDFAQLRKVSGGFFKSMMVHVAMVIFSELYTQVDEDSTVDEHNQATREFLKQGLRDIIDLAAERIAVGENNVKGHLFMSVVLAQLEAMEEGIDCERAVLEAAAKSADLCHDLLVSRISTDLNVPSQGTINDGLDVGGTAMQDFGMDFNMQDWVDQESRDAWFKSGFEDGVWWLF